MESTCIMCGKKTEGLAVREDYIIATIRWFKRNVTHNEKGNRLVVCKEDFRKYYKQRRSFERKRGTYIGLGVVFAVVLFLLSGFNLYSILYGIGIIVFLYLLSLISYVPGVDAELRQKTTEAANAPKRQGKHVHQ
ncbi:MAG: hypothetical protein QXN59_01240 [Candidatus Micrarchaeaceae archaeon]